MKYSNRHLQGLMAVSPDPWAHRCTYSHNHLDDDILDISKDTPDAHYLSHEQYWNERASRLANSARAASGSYGLGGSLGSVLGWFR